MEPLFCSTAARQAGEDLSGTAGHYQTYVLIECPLPWPAAAFDSPSIPPELRHYVKAASANKSVRFLCINRGISDTSKQTTLLIYEQQPTGKTRLPIQNSTEQPVVISAASHLTGENPTDGSYTQGYRGYEFNLTSLDQVAPCLAAYWQNKASQSTKTPELGQRIDRQDILICTHGMRDRCCAKLGQPIFRSAKRMAEKGILPNVRVWRSSHIGGHRFAPTAITLPDGRYYGRLSFSALQAIVTRQGAIAQLQPVYRGWGILPQPLQILEQQLLLQHGWSWLDHSVAYQQICSDVDSHEVTAKLSVRQANGKIDLYRARLSRDAQKTYYGKKSCSDASPSTVFKYAIADCSIEKNLPAE